jgi:hypothetical protein
MKRDTFVLTILKRNFKSKDGYPGRRNKFFTKWQPGAEWKKDGLMASAGVCALKLEYLWVRKGGFGS